MSDNHLDDSDPADAAIEEYLRLVDAGGEVDRAAFIAAHPEAAKELRSFFGSVSMLQRLAGPGGLAENDGTRSRSRPPRGASVPNDDADGASDSRFPWTSLPAMFGRYRVESLLGRGAMAAVYRAHDTQLDRPVALKLSHVPENTVLELRERMLQEARAAASLNHNNICRVYDVGEIGGTRFIAMELIEGRVLADYIRAGRLLPLKTAVTIIRKLALALQAAHNKGIVHRDLKPNNVIINSDREPILMDFGLAQRPVITGEERLTKAGMLIGSPAYMSPEQARADGTAIGPASDIYGLGVVFYEMLTGQLPFTGSVMTILAKVLSDQPPSPQSIRPEIDDELSDICRKMLAKQPADRFGSMNEVAEALQSWLKSTKSSRDVNTNTEASANPVVPRKPTPTRTDDWDFDGYRKWLGITAARRPPSHYELLGLKLDEEDHEVIQAVTAQRRHFVESKRGIGHDDQVAEILMRIDEAEITLLSNEMRRDYDRQQNLFEKRRKSRRIDPNATPNRIESRPGRAVGEEPVIVKTFAGIMAVICVGFGIMAWFSFQLPWNKTAKEAEVGPVQQPIVEQPPTQPQPGPPVVAQPPVRPQPAPATTQPTSHGSFAGSTASEEKSLVSGMKFRWCPEGEFTMGSPKSELDQNDNKRRDDEDQVQVTLSTGFWLGETEMTQDQWQKVMGTSPWQGKEHVKEGDDYAASYISYEDAVAFLEKLTSQERAAKRLPEGWKYALPTEAQWEYACRAGTKTKYSFGDSESESGQWGSWLSQYGWWGGGYGDGNAKSEQYAHRVGQKKPNAWGLRDMHGNVSEWCSDWYGQKLSGGADPVGASSGSVRVRRGGGWSSSASRCRVAIRFSSSPDLRSDYLGFRVAAVPVALGSVAERILPPTVVPVQETPKDATAEAMQAIQGEWLCVESEEGGKRIDKSTLIKEDRRATFNGNNFTMMRTKQERKGYVGKFEIDFEKGHFDFVGKNPGGNFVEWIGIYELKGDTLKLCYRYKTNADAVRPTQFKTDDKKPNVCVSYTYRRIKAESAPQGIQTPQTGEKVFESQEEIVLLRGELLAQWEPTPAGDYSKWSLNNGTLRVNSKGPSLVTKQKFRDFDLHLEFKLPPKCNSGVFLRGRYEVQLVDSQHRNAAGQPLPPTGRTGAIWAQIAPSKDAYRGPNKWNTLDVRLVGRKVTVNLNGSVVIDSQTINGVSGPGLDTNESEPGPILLQNTNSGGAEFRNIKIKPIRE